MEQTPPAVEEQAVATSSLPARLMNVYAGPGEVFDEVKSAPVQHSNWLVPALIAIVIGWIGSWIVFSQPAIEQQLRDISAEAIEKQIEKGKMSGQQAEQ